MKHRYKKKSLNSDTGCMFLINIRFITFTIQYSKEKRKYDNLQRLYLKKNQQYKRSNYFEFLKAFQIPLTGTVTGIIVKGLKSIETIPKWTYRQISDGEKC